MKKIEIAFIYLLGILLYSCSSTKESKINVSEIKRSNEVLYLKGEIQCPSDKIEYINNDIDLNFNKNVCALFEDELGSGSNTIIWYMDWLKKENEFYPISSMVKVYDNDKLSYDRSLSFKTWPSVSNEEEFKKSLYYRINQIRPVDKEAIADTISKLEVLLTIKK